MVDIQATGPQDPAPQADKNNRMYKSSNLPVLSSVPIAAKDAVTRTVLLAELNETAAAWRMLTDVRFKLLALLPPISALALTAIVSPKGVLEGAGVPVRAAAATFGFLVVLGLRIYDRRNDVLYNDLISRGRRVEFELGIKTGVFRGRKEPNPLWDGKLKVPRKLLPFAKRADLVGRVGNTISVIKHGIALKIVYGTVLAAWLLAGISIVAGWLPIEPAAMP